MPINYVCKALELYGTVLFRMRSFIGSPYKTSIWLETAVLGSCSSHTVTSVAFRNTIPADSETNPQNVVANDNKGLAQTSQENSVNQITITTFHDVEEPSAAVVPMPQNTSSIAHLDSSVSIAQFLERPVKLDQFKLVAGSTGDIAKPIKPVVFTQNDPQPSVRQYQFPGDLLALGGKLQKIANHQYFKADIRVKLVINTNPFVAGRFFLTYSPYENQVDSSRKQSCATRAGLTAYPGVEIDIQIDNTVEIVIPYSSYKEAYVLTEPENYVTMSLYSLTGIMTGEGNEGIVEFTFYAWFENIVINVPTAKIPAGINYSNNLAPAIVNRQADKISNAISLLKSTNPDYYRYIKSVLASKGVDLQIQTEAPGGPGPITSIASTVSGIAGQLESIPIVNEVAAPVKWVADIVGSVASIFGWSKPTTTECVLPLANLPGMTYTNAVGVDNSVSLSLLGAMNELTPPNDIFPSAVDEMDMEYVCRNPALKYSIPWAAGKPGEINSKTLTVLPVGIGPFDRYGDENTHECIGSQKRVQYTWQNQPIWPDTIPEGLYKAHYTTTPHILDTAPCEYVSQLFTYWRATLCFKISIVKTAFHSGRLEVSFDPGMWMYQKDKPWIPDLTKYDTLDTTNNYKYILDLTNDSEVTIKIPFVSERMFKSTQGANAFVFNESDPKAYEPTLKQIQDSIIGALIIRPVNDLLAPPNVSQNVQILIWKWAEDVVFGVPKPAIQTNLNIFSPYSAPEGACSVITIDRTGDDYEPTNAREKKAYADMISKIQKCSASNEVNQMARIKRKPREIGYDTVDTEMQINIINKADGNVEVFFQDTSMFSDGNQAAQMALGEKIINLRVLLRCFRDIYPQFTDLENRDQSGIFWSKVFKFQKEQQNTMDFYTDYLNYLSYMYRFFRGGYRYKFVPLDNKNTNNIKTAISFDVNQYNDIFTGPTHETFPNINPFHEVTVPYYSQYRRLPISVEDDIPALEVVLTLNEKQSNSPQVRILRSGNDDFTFGWMMGTPPLYQGVVVTPKCYDYTPLK